MKTFRSCAALCLAMGVMNAASAQITITAGDIATSLAQGRSITGRTDTTRRTVNIGTLGSTSWNFNPLTAFFTATSVSVRPDTTPFIGLFPGATHVLRTVVVGVTYTYYRLGTNLFFPGTGTTGSFSARTRSVPEQLLYQLPMTFGTSWTATYAESSVVILPPPLPPSITITNHSATNTVDAYGNLTMPGGGVIAALRLRTDRRFTTATSSGRTITYSFLAANGASVSVVAADTLQPNTGNIVISSASWSGGATDVRLTDAAPAAFALMQNYPNPFNPSTRIGFSVPASPAGGQASGFTMLRVFDILGREVATLVNENLAPGSYETTFDATSLASGVYFYRLQAGGLVQTKKLVLEK